MEVSGKNQNRDLYRTTYRKKNGAADRQGQRPLPMCLLYKSIIVRFDKLLFRLLTTTSGAKRLQFVEITLTSLLS